MGEAGAKHAASASQLQEGADLILEADGVRKTFPGVVALDGVSLGVRAGEVHAIVGENGAGKSTLVNVLCGALRPDEGSIVFLGEPFSPHSPRDAYRAGIRVVFQHLSLLPNLTVAENVFLGREVLRGFGFVHRAEILRGCRRLLDELGFGHIQPEVLVKSLTTSDRYLVEVAKAVLDRPRLLILDEPTASLNAPEAQLIFKLVRGLTAKGSGVVWITHRLDEVAEISDRVTVMRDACRVTTEKTANLTHEDLVRLMTGRNIDMSTGKEAPRRQGEAKFLAKEIHSAGGLEGVTVSVGEGEIVGVGGLAGSGVEELARVLYGLHPLTGGSVVALGREIHPRDMQPRRLAARGIFYLPGDRYGEGIIEARSVLENMTVSSLRRMSSAGFLRRPAERRWVGDYISRLGVRPAGYDREIRYLSGGNQQKVLFARGMMTHPQVLILEEPTQGVDIGAKADIYAVIRELAGQGAAILVISTDTRELLTVCDRIIAIRAGRVARVFERNEVSEEGLVRAYFGLGDQRVAV